MQLVNIGLCAFGMSGKIFHAPFIKEHPGFHLKAIVERNKQDSKEKYPEATLYRSVKEMLEDSSLQIIVVNTPVQTHFEYTKMALESGKNVIVEKPFTINYTEAKELIQLANEKKLFLTVYQNRRFDRDFLQIKKIVNGGLLGKIKEAEIRFDRYRPTPSGKMHKENPSMAGSGALHDLGAHLIDQSLVLFGKPNALFADVLSMKGTDYANDFFDITLYYPDHLRVRIKSSVFILEDHFSYKLFGEKGCFLQERSDTQEVDLVNGVMPIFCEEWMSSPQKSDGILHYLEPNKNPVRQETSSSSGNYMHYYQELYEHLVFGKTLPSPATEVAAVMQLIDAALEGAKYKKIIKLTNDPE